MYLIDRWCRVDGVEQSCHLVARIDDDPFAGVFAADDEAVLEERRRRPASRESRRRILQPEPVAGRLRLMGMSATSTYQSAVRVHTSVLAAVEKRLLVRIGGAAAARGSTPTT